MTRWLQPEFKRAFPVAHLLRTYHSQLWFRVHSLPESKRYAESTAEREIVFQRYRAFGTALLGANSTCLAIRSRPDPLDQSDPFASCADHGSTWNPFLDLTHEGEVWHSQVAEVRWEPQKLRPLLTAIAEDREGLILFLAPGIDTIFAPYDGGADGFSFDPQIREQLKREFHTWRSPQPSGC